MCLYIPFYIIALLSFNYKVQFCALKGDAQNLPLRRVGRGEIFPPSSSQRLTLQVWMVVTRMGWRYKQKISSET